MYWPVARTAAARASGVTSGLALTMALRAPRSTVALSTPGTASSAFIHVYPTMSEALIIGAQVFRKDVTKLSCCAE